MDHSKDFVHETFIKYINSLADTPLTGDETEMIKETFVPKKVRKKQYLLHEGEVCKYAGFIVNGAMRQYSIDNRGVEHIIGLMIENWWAVDRESYIKLTPSIYNIDAWEDTDLLVITRADMVNRINSIPAIIELSGRLDANHAFATQKRLNASISLSAEERYAQLSKLYPEFLQRFPQNYIASYLGITKETLSRIRHPSKKK